MSEKINLNENISINGKERKKIINILVKECDLNNSFNTKQFEDLHAKEIDHLFFLFEKNYPKIKNRFANNDLLMPQTFEEFKKISFGKCKTNFKDYKYDLLNILAKNKIKDFSKNVDIGKFLYLLSQTSDISRDYIVSRINDKTTLANTINNLSKESLRKLGYITNNILSNEVNKEKLIRFLESIGNKLPECLEYDEEFILLFIKKLDSDEISQFFDLNKHGNNHFEIGKNCNYEEKIIDLIKFIGCRTFLLIAKDKDPDTFSKLIDRTITKILGTKLLEGNIWNEEEPIDEKIKIINQEVSTRKNAKVKTK